MAKLSPMFISILLIGFSLLGHLPNVRSGNNESDSDLQTKENESHDTVNFGEGDLNINVAVNGSSENTRRKRTILPTNNGLNSPTNIEGLLSSCQLTNLLLYQLLNQRSFNNPSESNVNNILQPFPAAGGLGLPGILPGPINLFAPAGPVLQTYTTTSNFLTTMTTSSIHTITLLFGNKESRTTVTQTKVINVSTSTVLTLTSTVQPTPPTQLTTLEEIQPTATLPPTVTPSKYYEDEPGNEVIQKKLYQESLFKPHSNPHPQPELKPARQKQRRKYAREKKIENYRDDQYPEQLSQDSSSLKFGEAINFTPKKQQRFIPDRPESHSADDEYSYQKDYNGRDYYVRRLKRRGEVEAAASTPEEVSQEYDNPDLEREYLLEPSSDASFIEGIAVEACPMPNVVTITKTVTKYVNPSASVRLNNENEFSNDASSGTNFGTRSSDTDNNASSETSNENSRRGSRRFKSPKSSPNSEQSTNKQRSSTNRSDVQNQNNKRNVNEASPRFGKNSEAIIRSINDNRRLSRYRSSPEKTLPQVRLSSSESRNNPDTTRSRFIQRVSYIKK